MNSAIASGIDPLPRDKHSSKTSRSAGGQLDSGLVDPRPLPEQCYGEADADPVGSDRQRSPREITGPPPKRRVGGSGCAAAALCVRSGWDHDRAHSPAHLRGSQGGVTDDAQGPRACTSTTQAGSTIIRTPSGSKPDWPTSSRSLPESHPPCRCARPCGIQ
jgi:hypothetical protein